MVKFRLSNHDSHPDQESRAVDLGLGQFNDRAAPLHEVRLLSCFAHDDCGQLLGGAIGRWWGSNCELQQLWVAEAHRGQGLGAALITEFEISARRHGCTSCYLETFSFQALQLYERLGYRAEYVRRGLPHGIVKYHMVKQLGAARAEV